MGKKAMWLILYYCQDYHIIIGIHGVYMRVDTVMYHLMNGSEFTPIGESYVLITFLKARKTFKKKKELNLLTSERDLGAGKSLHFSVT